MKTEDIVTPAVKTLTSALEEVTPLKDAEVPKPPVIKPAAGKQVDYIDLTLEESESEDYPSTQPRVTVIKKEKFSDDEREDQYSTQPETKVLKQKASTSFSGGKKKKSVLDSSDDEDDHGHCLQEIKNGSRKRLQPNTEDHQMQHTGLSDEDDMLQDAPSTSNARVKRERRTSSKPYWINN